MTHARIYDRCKIVILERILAFQETVRTPDFARYETKRRVELQGETQRHVFKVNMTIHD
jgi:hypothetical protein